MSIVLASAARATTGARSGQEDAFQLWPADGVARPEGESGGLLAVLADGMGGHIGGAVAGQTACSKFAEVFAAATSPYDQRLQSALDASNEALAKGVEENAALRGMGCTIVAAWLDTLGIRWASVGDSLLLLYRFPDVIRLNADHSLGSFLDEQARQNRISASEAKEHHNRNALRSALTGAKIDLIDLRSEPLELQAGDWVLIASDGICSLEGDEIADVVYNFRQSTPAEMADGLIAAVVRKGVAGQDNTTVVAIRVDPAKTAADAETTRVLRGRGDKEEKELRSRRIGSTGRKTSIPGRARATRPARTAIWLVAAAVFFLFFAAAILLRSLQTSSVTTPEATTSTPSAPAAAAVPERAVPDAPDTTGQDSPRSRIPAGPAPTTPDTPPTTGPDASHSPPTPPRVAPPPPQKSGATPPAKAASPPIQQATPVPPSTRAAPDSQSLPAVPPPAPAPSAQPGESQEWAPRTEKARRPPKDGEKAVRKPREAKESSKDGPKDLPKKVPRDIPKDPPKDVLPWGFSND
jgi:serine/threonine protein phosphatase PrpC